MSVIDAPALSGADLTDGAPRGGTRVAAVPIARRAGALGMAALPGAMTVYLSFHAGGYFAGPTGVVMATLAALVALRMAFVTQPFAGFGRPLIAAVVALGAFALWTLLSSAWSGAPARALLNFDLAAVYLLTLVLVGSSARSHRRVRWTVALTWLGMLVVCAAAVATRLRPDLFPIPLNMSPNRLAYPLTYWNALGIFAVIGLVLATYLTASTREAPLMRVIAAASAPVFAVTILLTFSRAAYILAPVALVAFALLARPRGLLSAVAAAVPTSAVAVLDTYHAQLISNADTTTAAVAQGRHLSFVVVLMCVAAATIRAGGLTVDRRLLRVPLSRRNRRRARRGLAGVCLLVAAAVIFAFGGRIAHQVSNFTKSDVSAGSDVRARVGNIRIGGRLEGWRIALRAFDQSPVHGLGAGTFANDWYRYRNTGGVALQAHSLYLQAMSELGIVGLLTLVAALAILIVACFGRSRHSSARSLWIALGLVGAVWAVHAGVDWDWQMPAVTLPVFALSACAVARRGRPVPLAPPVDLSLRVLVGIVAIGIAVTGVRVAVSDGRLNDSVAAFAASNCPVAAPEAASSIAALGSRPQGWAVLGYCAMHTGHTGQAIADMRAAVSRDPQDWRYAYGLAVAQAAAGQSPAAAIDRARALDPLEPMIQTTAASLRGHSRRRWRESALAAPMPVSTRE